MCWGWRGLRDGDGEGEGEGDYAAVSSSKVGLTGLTDLLRRGLAVLLVLGLSVHTSTTRDSLEFGLVERESVLGK